MNQEELTETIKEDVVVDYEGKEILLNDKVKFITQTDDGEEEYWVGKVIKITDIDVDVDEDGKAWDICPIVEIEYSYMGNAAVERYYTRQEINKYWIFVCDELEVLE